MQNNIESGHIIPDNGSISANEGSVHASLLEYTRLMNQNFLPYEIAWRYGRSGPSMDVGFQPYMRQAQLGSSLFLGCNRHFADAMHSLILEEVPNGDSPIGSALIGFNIVPPFERNMYQYTRQDSEEYLEARKDLRFGDVFITQIQSTHVSHNHRFLNGWRWERMLVAVVSDWARKNGYSRIVIQPASMGVYWTDKISTELKIRYDGTARAMGFKKSPHGLWVRELHQDRRS